MQKVLRTAGLLLGAAILLWLPFEDTGIRWVVLFAGAISALLAAGVLQKRALSGWPSWMSHPLTGLLAGAAVTPIAFLLMALKSGVHGHGAPDFTPQQVTSLLNSTPLFGLAGGIIGLGTGLYRRIRRSK